MRQNASTGSAPQWKAGRIARQRQLSDHADFMSQFVSFPVRRQWREVGTLEYPCDQQRWQSFWPEQFPLDDL